MPGDNISAEEGWPQGRLRSHRSHRSSGGCGMVFVAALPLEGSAPRCRFRGCGIRESPSQLIRPNPSVAWMLSSVRDALLTSVICAAPSAAMQARSHCCQKGDTPAPARARAPSTLSSSRGSRSGEVGVEQQTGFCAQGGLVKPACACVTSGRGTSVLPHDLHFATGRPIARSESTINAGWRGDADRAQVRRQESRRAITWEERHRWVRQISSASLAPTPARLRENLAEFLLGWPRMRQSRPKH